MNGTERGVIVVNDAITIREEEIELRFVQASGPGGQNVNKVASAVQLRFDTSSPSLPDGVRQRMMRIANKRIGKEGVLLIEAKRYRTQEQNRDDAIGKLVELIRRASIPPKVRRKTKPSAAAKHKRLEAKRRRGEVKRLRGRSNEEID